MLTVIVRSVFEKDSEYYPQVILDECLYDLWKCCSMRELIFQKELMLINQANQKNLCFAIIGILNILVLNFHFKFNHIHVMDALIYR